MNLRSVPGVRRFLVMGVLACSSLLSLGGQAVHAAVPQSCTVDLVTNTHTCQSVGQISFISAPANGQTMFKIYLDPAQYTTAVFDVSFNSEPTGWTINVGDSRTNNGGGGDANTQSNDSELQLYNQQLAVLGNDNTPGTKQLLIVDNFAAGGTSVSFTIKNNRVDWRNWIGQTGTLNSAYIFALNNQADSQGTRNYDIYAAFNRVVDGNYRSGTGASQVTVTLY
jgi:hypothetical protein